MRDGATFKRSRGVLVEFPKEKFAAQSKTEDITERGEVSQSTVLCFGCF